MSPRGRLSMYSVLRATKDHIRLSDATMTMHDMALRYLVEYFGKDRRLDSIHKLDGEGWHQALCDGKLVGARKVKPRHKRAKEAANGESKGDLSVNSIRTTTRTIKGIFSWAVAHDYLAHNPFDSFIGTGVKAKDNPHVPIEHFHRLIEVAPQPWKALLGLCRLAGLRRGEALSLPWNGSATAYDGEQFPIGVDFGAKIIRAVGKGERFREIPICPELDTILAATLEAQRDGTELVVYPVTANNALRTLEQLQYDAGITAWRKSFQSLRSSCENDWKTRGIAEATYCRWIGHSVEVSRGHYVAPTDAEFLRITAPDETPARSDSAVTD